MGGGGGSTTTQYQKPRTGVDPRQYGELSNGFRSRDEYEEFLAYRDKVEAAKNEPKYIEGMNGELELNPASIIPTSDKFTYDEHYDTYTLANGVDVEASIKDWNNYENERIEIATYNAKEDRRKKAPDELQNSQTVDLSIKQDKTKDKKVPTVTQSYDTSPSTASTNQPLGIY